MQAGLSTKNAPSWWVVLPHYAYGAVAFIVAAIMLFASAGEVSITTLSPKILGFIHLLILGWITMIIFGALYQLIPVVMEVKLKSEILAIISFITLGIGTPLIAYSFWTAFIGPTIAIMAGGTLVLLSVLLFVINTLLTASVSKVKSIENRFIKTSVIWLLLTVILGVTIIIHPALLSKNFMSVHIHFGVVGWFMMLVVGVASILLPMFFISHNLNKNLLKWAYFLINGGLISLSAGLYLAWKPMFIFLFSAVMIAGFVLFIKYNYAAYKNRLRKKLDIGMKHTVMAFVLLIIALTAALISSLSIESISTQANLIYGFALFPGFLTALILGQMYKTLPFIVWLKIYQTKVGKYKTPLPADMHSKRAADWHYYSYLSFFIVTIAAVVAKSEIIMQIGAAFLVLTSILYAFNTFKILMHKEKLEPLMPFKPSK